FDQSQSAGVEFESSTGTAVLSGAAAFATRRYGGGVVAHTARLATSGTVGAISKYEIKSIAGEKADFTDFFSGAAIGASMYGADVVGRGTTAWAAARNWLPSNERAARAIVYGSTGGLANSAATSIGYTGESLVHGNFDGTTLAKEAGYGFL